MLAGRNIVFGVYFINLYAAMPAYDHYNSSCGIDKSPFNSVFEGAATIETYPWLGYLVYRSARDPTRYTTTVVLVTKQIVIATASEINRMPKYDFRARARVVLGHNCSWSSIPVRDYTYHPDYVKKTHSALALIQLDLDFNRQELTPICPPPSFFIKSVFYAMTITPECKKPVVQIYQMEHVDPAQCKVYYRKSGLNLRTLWPTHTACGKARHGGECLWRGGTVLALKQAGRWRLLGFGIFGPGCEAPSRFLDYGMYHQWIQRSVERTGRPSVTRLGPNHVILRRSLANVQRYGRCDEEEKKIELYTDETTVNAGISGGFKRVKYNTWHPIDIDRHVPTRIFLNQILESTVASVCQTFSYVLFMPERVSIVLMTIYANIDYSCIIFRAQNFDERDRAPRLRLRRWCAGTPRTCSGFQYVEIDFYVEVTFSGKMKFTMRAYGRKAVAIDAKRAMKYLNRYLEYPRILSEAEVAVVLKRVRPNMAAVPIDTTTSIHDYLPQSVLDNWYQVPPRETYVYDPHSRFPENRPPDVDLESSE